MLWRWPPCWCTKAFFSFFVNWLCDWPPTYSFNQLFILPSVIHTHSLSIYIYSLVRFFQIINSFSVYCLTLVVCWQRTFPCVRWRSEMESFLCFSFTFIASGGQYYCLLFCPSGHGILRNLLHRSREHYRFDLFCS